MSRRRDPFDEELGEGETINPSCLLEPQEGIEDLCQIVATQSRKHTNRRKPGTRRWKKHQARAKQYFAERMEGLMIEQTTKSQDGTMREQSSEVEPARSPVVVKPPQNIDALQQRVATWSSDGDHTAAILKLDVADLAMVHWTKDPLTTIGRDPEARDTLVATLYNVTAQWQKEPAEEQQDEESSRPQPPGSERSLYK